VRETSLDFLSKCLLVTEFRFEAMCSYLGNENSDTVHIKYSRGPHLAGGPQVPLAWSRALLKTTQSHVLHPQTIAWK